MANAEEPMDPERLKDAPLLTVKQFAASYPWPTELGMRSYIFQSKKNGNEHCFPRVGRRRLVDPKAFFEWIKSNHDR